MADTDLIKTFKVLLEKIEQISVMLNQLEKMELSEPDLRAAMRASLEFTAKAAAVARDGASLSARLELRGRLNGKLSKPR